MGKELQFPSERICTWDLEYIGDNKYQVVAECGKVTKTTVRAVKEEISYCPYCGGKLLLVEDEED